MQHFSPYRPCSTGAGTAQRSRLQRLRAIAPLLFAACAVALAGTCPAHAQATTATAIKKADLQVGGYFTFSKKPDYGTDTLYGGGGYLTYDFTHSFGVEANIKQINSPTGNDIYERTYEVGARYVKHINIVYPYARLSYGRAVFNYQGNIANLAYNMYSAGAGADIRVRRHLNVRGDAEYQVWQNFPANRLTPIVISVGAAYHF